MRLGIMQPYFFPYAGHFALIAHVDQWLVFDITQYTPRTWMNRNRILHPTQGWNYVSVPLANSSISIRTDAARLQDPAAALKSIQGKLSHYRRAASYYRNVVGLVETAFAELADDRLVTLDVAALKATCAYLALPFDYRICSDMGLDLPPDLAPGSWAPALCARLGAEEYLNPIGGRHLFDEPTFRACGTQLKVLDFAPLSYTTDPYRFEPQLSILDTMMWCSPREIREALSGHSRILDGFSHSA